MAFRAANLRMNLAAGGGKVSQSRARCKSEARRRTLAALAGTSCPRRLRVPPEPAGGWDSLSPQGDTCRAVPKAGGFLCRRMSRGCSPPLREMRALEQQRAGASGFPWQAAKGRAGKATALCLNALLLLPERAFQPSDREKPARKTQHKLQLRVRGGNRTIFALDV